MKAKGFNQQTNFNPPKKFEAHSKKDGGKPVRISTAHYERLRTEAFSKNIPIKTLLDEIIESYYSSV